MKSTHPDSDFGHTSKKPVDLIVQGGTAVTMAPGQKPIKNARILIHQDRITQMGPSEQIPIPQNFSGETIDARNAIVIPGLVNGHAHTAMTLFRGFADDLPLE